MFGMGGSEILVILIVALLFLGPDKLPDAAKQISKGIRDLKKQSRVLQQTIENDEHIGGAIRDLKSALRGDELPVRPPARPLPKPATPPEGTTEAKAPAEPIAEPEPEKRIMPPTAGEPDPAVPADETKPEELAALIKPATGVVPKSAPQPAADKPVAVADKPVALADKPKLPPPRPPSLPKTKSEPVPVVKSKPESEPN